MGNCISKINKEHFFVFEEFMKNDILLLKGKVRSDLERGIRGKTYTGFYSIKKLPEKIKLVSLQTGVWWRGLFEKTSRHYSFCISTSIKKKNDGPYQRSTYKYIHRANRVWKNSPCFRLG